jgi:uncharacterized protein
MNSVTITLAGETLELFAAKAAFWPRAKALLVADVHLGKASAFRRSGIPVPEQVTEADLRRLSDLMALRSSDRLIVLGDLFHSRAGLSEATLNSFVSWRHEHQNLQIDLLVGNHDLQAGPFPNEWNIRASKELRETPFVLAHQARLVPGHFGLFGHVHPAVRCAGMRLPCFHFASSLGLLPAFGSFTGTHCIGPGKSDRVFAVGDGEIAEISPAFFA